jgi:hypothetical protein
VVELKFWNNFAGPPFLQFAHRAVLMPGGNSWAPYSLDASIQQVTDMPNDGLGFHRFTALISLTNILFSLDLFNDGLNNVTSNPGIDAQDSLAAVVRQTASMTFVLEFPQRTDLRRARTWSLTMFPCD